MYITNEGEEIKYIKRRKIMNDVIAKDEVVIEDLIYEIRGKKLMLDSEYL